MMVCVQEGVGKVVVATLITPDTRPSNKIPTNGDSLVHIDVNVRTWMDIRADKSLALACKEFWTNEKAVTVRKDWRDWVEATPLPRNEMHHRLL